MFFAPPKTFNAATNALLAEHSLSLTELVRDNPVAKQLKDAVVQIWRFGTRSTASEKDICTQFNSQQRLVQLNLLAMALNELGFEPLLSPEMWLRVANPFVSVPKPRYLRAVANRLRKKYGVSIQIPERQFRMLDWGLGDGDESAIHSGNAESIFTGGTPVRAYECGIYRAVLVNEPTSIGPARYRYALLVFSGQDGETFRLAITAEESMAAAFLDDLPDELRKELGEDVGKSLFLGVLDEAGHSNLGPSVDCSSIERFEARALAEMKKRLDVSSPVRVLNP